MKKNFDLHEIIKDAVKEALLEVLSLVYGVSTMAETPNPSGGEGDGEDDNGGNNNSGGNNSGNNGGNNNGGDGNGGILDPIWGPSGFSLRKN